MSANERIADQIVGHAVDLSLYSNGVAGRMMAVLAKAEPDLFERLQAALSRLDVESFTVRRLEALLEDVFKFNVARYARLLGALRDELLEFIDVEAQFHFESTIKAIPKPAAPMVRAISQEQAYAAAMARPFQGRLLKEWISSLESDQAKRIRDTIRIGFVSNKTIDEMVRELRGTRSAGYMDGIINIDRRNAEAVVRTAVGHFAGVVRERFYDRNADIVAFKVWVSTLDSRTTEQCQVRDGLRYTLDGKPIGHKVPWGAGPGQLHWNCRSTSMPVLKSWEELGLPEGTRASMDGQVPSSTSYRDWLARQSSARQDEILGPTRGALLRSGKLTIDRFWNERGRFLTLAELRERNPGIGA